MAFGQMALDLKKDANRVELKINTNETKDLIITGRILTICSNGQNIEGFDQFVYPSGVISVDDVTEVDLSQYQH